MLKGFDLFPKIQQDQSQQIRKTLLGGLLFVMTVCLTLLLIGVELYSTLIKGEMDIRSFVESSNLDQRVRVNLNISMHEVPCHALSLELQDVTGAHLEDVKYTLHKLSLYPNGTFINSAKAQQMNTLEKHISYPSNPLVKAYKKWKGDKVVDDCYGAQLYEGQKCPSCQDVMLAFAARDWPSPPRESIAQCMPDRKATVELMRFEEEFNQILANHQDEILGQISQELLDVEEREREIELKQQQYDLAHPEENTKPQGIRDVLTSNQKKRFAQTLQELSEISQNPMQWNQDRLQEEKLAKVSSLINMLNVSLDDYTSKLQSQLRFTDREIVIAERKLLREPTNLTMLIRQKCDQSCTIELNLSSDGLDQNLLLFMESGECSLQVTYSCTEMTDDRISIDLGIGNQFLTWTINKGATVKSILSNLNVNITNVTLEGNRGRQPIDTVNRNFRLSVYIPLKTIRFDDPTRRMLYQEDFNVRDMDDETTLDLADAYDIQEHLGEGCQIFGHLFVKKVPGSFHLGFHGRGEAARLLSNNFSVAHTIHHFELTDEKEPLTFGKYVASTNPIDSIVKKNLIDQDTNYYLKIVGSLYESMWGGLFRLYTFTAHEKTTPSKERLPAVIFRYEFDAVTMKYSSKRGSLLQLLVSIIGIIGGVFAVSNMFSKMLEYWGW